MHAPKRKEAFLEPKELILAVLLDNLWMSNHLQANVIARPLGPASPLKCWIIRRGFQPRSHERSSGSNKQGLFYWRGLQECRSPMNKLGANSGHVGGSLSAVEIVVALRRRAEMAKS